MHVHVHRKITMITDQSSTIALLTNAADYHVIKVYVAPIVKCSM